MGEDSPRQRITNEVPSWAGVEVRPHRFGGVTFYAGRREIGHLYGDRLLDVPLTKAMRDRYVAEGKAQPHRHVPDSG